MWMTASRISSWASASGLPVSVCTSSASRPMYLITCDFQASSRCRRSFQLSPAHHSAAAWARATVAATSASLQTGKVAMTSEVAGFSVSKVSVLDVVVVVIIASTGITRGYAHRHY